MYVFYTIPLTWSTSQVDPETIAWLFPDHSVISESLGVNVPELISGLASSIIWSFFFMMCPQVFKVRSRERTGGVDGCCDCAHNQALRSIDR
jgi:hypothetical protein